ncbi:hypothetical protein HDV05_002394 [Chytridiales sp. JEL 0842]|nr:hypothetical protein HDV05_002394 [Chytridiales sp. JEL 0842]
MPAKANNNPVAAHIDRDKLYTDTMYRFDYLCKFVGFDESDIKAIKASAPLVAPLVPTIVDTVYVKLFSFDITKETFMQRGEGFHGQLATNLAELDLNNDQIKFRKDFLGKYFVKLVTGAYDANFVKYLDWVGRIHTATPTKKSKINVEYIHCGALFGFVHGFLAETIDKHPDLQDQPEVRAKVLSAFSKLLWIQNDLFAKYYVKDGQDLMDGTNKPSIWASLSNGDFLRGAVVGTVVVAVSAFVAARLGLKA